MPRNTSPARNLFPLLLVVAILVPFASASGPYEKGSSNTVSADPNIKRPSTTPCVVRLFSGAQFTDFNVENFDYAPPPDCPGPWAKVVLEADISLNAGIQYDRTANFWLGPVNIYFGTTAEPSNIGPSWHIENDLTDYSAIFTIPKTGQADIGNTLCCGLTSTIYASASLKFYPLAEGETAPVTADQVLALSGGTSGGTVGLNTTSSTLSGTFDFPLNVQEAYLDVYAQSQSNDEFWYTCSPNDVAAELGNNCGNTGFRETEITIDGQPAGVAPVFPWIFTGGIDPYLWFPIPGVQTLNFTPYRVNLTPFAGLLSNGVPHTISLSVYNADSYFSATASMLVYRDPTTPIITGAITQNTLTAAPSPVVTENLDVQSTFTRGDVDVSSRRQFAISGYIDTSHGKVTTKVAQDLNFFNNQYFSITNNAFVQDITLGSSVASTTTTSSGGTITVNRQSVNFPLTLDIYEFFAPSGDLDVTTKATQNYTSTVSTLQNNVVAYTSSLVNIAQHDDTIDYTTFLNSNQSSSQQYNYWDSTGAGYLCDLAAANNVLTYFSPGCAK
jgi:Peptide N-acetyl-beta-D-glucosaminyl asparaginase amidase A